MNTPISRIPPAPQPAAPPQPVAIGPNAVLYQVLEVEALVGPNGDQRFKMMGPFPDLASASHYSISRPGSLIACLVILHQAPHAAPPPLQPVK